VDKQTIRLAVEKLVEAYEPLTVFIFGSFAWGTPGPDSDLDLMVIVNHSKEPPYERILKGLKYLRGLKISRDILVYTHDEFENLAQNKASLCYKIKNEGIKAYESA